MTAVGPPDPPGAPNPGIIVSQLVGATLHYESTISTLFYVLLTGLVFKSSYKFLINDVSFGNIVLT